MDEEVTIGIDIGGTNIKGVLINEKGTILEEVTTKTEDDPEDSVGILWKGHVLKTVSYLRERSSNEVKLAGLSAPGLANQDNSCISYMPERLHGLEDFNWSQFLGLETFVLNDAHAYLIAESKIGVGQGYKNIVLFTLGTGVGGGILINGELYQGEKGRAGHLGHISLNQKENTSIVGTPGSLENSIGECTLEERSFGKYHSTKDLVKAYQDGDNFATWVWLRSLEHLARGIVSAINSFSPQLVILGGGITRAGAALLDPLKDFLEVYEWKPGGFSVDIKLASEGSKYNGAIGAALFSIIRKEEQ